MNQKPILLSDWHRILFGEAPAMFAVETLIRTLIIFAALLVTVRLLGKRMNGQLTITEMAVMITLGAIVALPMQTPNQGILEGLFILVCAWAFQRGLNLITFKSAKAEKALQGSLSVLVRDGVLDVRELLTARISRDQLFSAVRNDGIYNLGQVKRAYLEACGLMSIYRWEGEHPGLSILPSRDKDIRPLQPPAADGLRACRSCGRTLATKGEHDVCPTCHANEWEAAVL